MPLQNRVTPFGDIIADPARGMFMGNRGGRIHDPVTKTLQKRRWASRQWLICRLNFKNRHRPVMGRGYTELFFLDEITAFAAGHRPCFECRRDAANAFFAAHQAFYESNPGLPKFGRRMYAADMDMLLHLGRMEVDDEKWPIEISWCPDGTMFNHDGHAWALRGGRLLRWTPGGYDHAILVKGIDKLVALTPMTTIGVLQHGYEPTWHPSADAI